MTGVLITSLRVFGQTESFGLRSNSHSFLPVFASKPRTQPSPCPITTCTVSPILPTAGDDHWPWRIFSPTELSSQTISPVTLLTAMIAGALGDGTLTWLSSWPFDVLM